MIGGGDAKENTLFTVDSCQWLTVPQRISAGRRAHVTRAEEGGTDSIEEAAAVVRTVQSRCGYNVVKMFSTLKMSLFYKRIKRGDTGDTL
jgi:hypothetical protein